MKLHTQTTSIQYIHSTHYHLPHALHHLFPSLPQPKASQVLQPAAFTSKGMKASSSVSWRETLVLRNLYSRGFLYHNLLSAMFTEPSSACSPCIESLAWQPLNMFDKLGLIFKLWELSQSAGSFPPCWLQPPRTFTADKANTFCQCVNLWAAQ